MNPAFLQLNGITRVEQRGQEIFDEWSTQIATRGAAETRDIPGTFGARLSRAACSWQTLCYTPGPIT